MTPRINIGLNAKGFEDIVTEITKNRRFWPPHCRLRPPCHRIPTNIRKILIPSERRVPGLHFCRW